MDLDLSIVIPVYNEEENLPELYKRLEEVVPGMGVSYEYILVNDGSKDNSFEIIKDLAKQNPHVKYISFSRNFGHQIAFFAGMDFAVGKAVLTMDGDLQDPPELIPNLYNKIKEGYEVVYAKRKTRQGVSFFKKLSYKLFYKLLKRLTEIDIPLDTGDFRIADRNVVDIVKKMNEQPKFLRGQVAWVGFNQYALEYDREKRFAGEPGYTYSKLFRLAIDGITSFSDLPLRMASMFGFLVSGIAFIMILWIIYAKFFPQNAVQGWYSTMVAILFLGGIQLMCIGIIGEYISRIFSNTQNRPVYVIKETNLHQASSTGK